MTDGTQSWKIDRVRYRRVCTGQNIFLSTVLRLIDRHCQYTDKLEKVPAIKESQFSRVESHDNKNCNKFNTDSILSFGYILEMTRNIRRREYDYIAF